MSTEPKTERQPRELTNQNATLKAQSLLRLLLQENLTPGAHVEISVRCVIQDGVVQMVYELTERKYRPSAKTA